MGKWSIVLQEVKLHQIRLSRRYTSVCPGDDLDMSVCPSDVLNGPQRHSDRGVKTLPKDMPRTAKGLRGLQNRFRIFQSISFTAGVVSSPHTSGAKTLRSAKQ